MTKYPGFTENGQVVPDELLAIYMRATGKGRDHPAVVKFAAQLGIGVPEFLPDLKDYAEYYDAVTGEDGR